MSHVSVDATSPTDWRYTAEGGANLVLSYAGPPSSFYSGRLLRLRKRKLQASSTSYTETIHDEVDIVFGSDVVKPLLGADQVVESQLVSVSRQWLQTINDELVRNNLRPASRSAVDEIDTNAGVAVLGEDLIHGQNVLAVEIKPKWAFLPAAPSLLDPAFRDIKLDNCRFCLHSHLKAEENVESRSTNRGMESDWLERHDRGYCPLDLFSLDSDRMERAIEGLWYEWDKSEGTANNLRIFWEGERVLPGNIPQSMLDRLSSNRPPSEPPPTALSLITSAILPPLLASPLLPTLARLQSRLDPLDIEGLSRLYALGLEPGASPRNSPPPSIYSPPPPPSEDTTLTAQPSMDEWRTFLSSPASKRILNTPVLSHHLEPIDFSRREMMLAYLLSATFKDCSIFVRLSPVAGEGEGARQWDTSVRAIDLDPKPVTKMRRWLELDRKIVDSWRKMLDSREIEGKGKLRRCRP